MQARAFRLNDGDVISIMTKSGDRYELKFEGDLFYEVGFNGYEYYETLKELPFEDNLFREVKFKGYEYCETLNEHKFGINPQYMKTGRVFTIDEMNKLIIGD